MASPFTHRGTLQQVIHDFDATPPATFSAGYQGSYMAPAGPDGLSPAGDPGAPKWFIQVDLSQIGFVEMYGDGSVTRDYRLPVSIWAESEMLESVYQVAGAELETYFAGVSETGWTFRTSQIEPREGVAEVGGFSGKTFEIPVEVG